MESSRRSALVVLLGVLALILVAGIGYIYSRNLALKQQPINPTLPQQIPSVPAYENNETDLTKIYSTLNKNNNLKECHYFDNCFSNILTPNTRFEIAQKYNVVKIKGDDSDIKIGLLKGSSIDIYNQSRKTLGIENNSWYWEIGACSTNNRIFVDALTGKTSILHLFVYCSGPESM